MVKPKKKKLKMLSVDWDGNLVPEKSNKIEGFGGWLTLWLIYFVLAGVGLFISFFVIPFLGISFSEVGIMNLLSGIIYLAFYIWMMVAFFTKKKIFILLVTIFLAYSTIQSLFKSQLFIVAINVLWIIYFYRAKRVKNTFVN